MLCLSIYFFFSFFFVFYFLTIQLLGEGRFWTLFLCWKHQCQLSYKTLDYLSISNMAWVWFSFFAFTWDGLPIIEWKYVAKWSGMGVFKFKTTNFFFFYFTCENKKFPFFFFINYIELISRAPAFFLFFILNIITDWSWSKWPQQSFHSTYTRVSN